MKILDKNSNKRIHACMVETSLELISGKWKPRILWKLHHQGVMRFGQLRRELCNITPKMLTQQLRELEKDGLVYRKVYAQVPPKVEYSLSEFGSTLKPVLDVIAQWGVKHNNYIVEVLEQSDNIQIKKVA